MARLVANTVLANPQGGEPVVLLAGEDVPNWAASLLGDHLVEATEVDAEESPYAGMTVADLKAVIESRNAGREPDAHLPATGKKGDLVAVLTDDDAAAADGSGDTE